MMESHIQAVEVVCPCPKLGESLSFFTDRLGFRVKLIYPADSPSVAVLSGYGVCLRLQEGSDAPQVFFVCSVRTLLLLRMELLKS